jgi:hypothetical protein
MGLMPSGTANPFTKLDKQRVSRLRLPSSRATVTTLAFVPLALVALSAGPGAQSPTPPRSVAGRAGAPGPQIDANGFKVGEEVLINTGQGWMKGTILSANGNVYRVRSQIGIDTTKIYPDEVRRTGPLTAKDRAAGQYNLHEAVQVNVNGTWVDGEIIATSGMEYQVQLPGRRTVWANPQAMRLGAAPVNAAAPKSGVPPKPGLSSCAGKIEGRYATTGGFASMTIVFRSGKAIMRAPFGEDDELECWMGGGRVYLHKPGESQDMPLDINDDGTLQSPFGELKRKGN